MFASKHSIYPSAQLRAGTKREDTLKSFDAICNGEADDLPEQAFLGACPEYVEGSERWMTCGRAKEMA